MGLRVNCIAPGICDPRARLASPAQQSTEPRRRAYRQMLEAFVRALRPDATPAPCIAFFNGLDSTKEMIYGSADWIAETFRELGAEGVRV